MTTLLDVENLRIRFRSVGALQALLRRVSDPYVQAVNDVSFSLAPGETLALVGESGAGKSTLARAVVGLVPAHAGSIRFLGKELVGRPQRAFTEVRREAAMMFQDPAGSLSPRLTVSALITEPFRIHGMAERANREEMLRLLQMVNLTENMAGYFPHQLSGGQARRVGVARALALSPQMIVADEPTAGLDVSVQGEILNLMARLQRETGVSFLIITHNLSVVRHISDRMAIMYLGRFVEQGPTDEIFHHPRHPYTHALLSATPDPDPDSTKEKVKLQGEIPSLMNRPEGCEFHTRCPFARQRCLTEPPGSSMAGARHYYTCHYPLEREPRPSA